MKSLVKNQNNKFICEECNKSYTQFCDLSRHIGLNHDKRKYYDKYLKEENEDVCPICNNKNPYLNRWDRGYKKTCSKKCANILRHQSQKETLLKDFDVENVMQIKEVREKFENTCLEKFGFKTALQNKDVKEKSRQTCLNHFGVDNPCKSAKVQHKMRNTMKEKYGVEYSMQSEEIRNKSKETNIKKYGVEYPSQNEEIKQKIKKTTKETTGYYCIFENRKLMLFSMLEKYGVENISQLQETQDKIIKTNLVKYGFAHHFQNKDVFLNAQKTSFKLKQFRNTNIWYQGSYELDFLEKYYDKFINIQRGPSIKYKLKNKNRVYHSDFFIPLLNLVIECKSSYYYKIFKIQDRAKKKATIANGFNYIMIIDKKYNKFNKLFCL